LVEGLGLSGRSFYDAGVDLFVLHFFGEATFKKIIAIGSSHT
jgi:hypothetical protein